MQKTFRYAPLALALGAALTSPAFAVTDLGVLNATLDRQGSKIKTNVVTIKDQNESTEDNLRGLLTQEPAIGIGGGNGTSQFFYIRGMGQNSIDVKVDNAYSDSQIHYHQGRFMLDPALVKVVSVQKGAGSASAGIGATNGAIVAKTLDTKDLLSPNQDYGIKAHAGYSSNKGYSYGVSAYGQSDQSTQTGFDGLISYNRVNEGNYKGGGDYKNLLGDSIVRNSALDKQSYLAKAGVNLDNHRLVASYLQETHAGNRPVREEFDFANARPDLSVKAKVGDDINRLLTDEQKALSSYKLGTEIVNPKETDLKKQEYYVIDANGNRVPDIKRNEGSQKRMKQSIANLEWSAYNLPFAESAKANVYKMNTDRWAANDSNNGYAGKINGETKMGIQTIGANINFDTGINDTTLLKYGVNYRTQEVSPARFFSQWTDKKGVTRTNPTLNNQQKTDMGVYAEAINQLGNTTVTTGIRYDRFNFKAMDGKTISGTDINPSLGVIYQVMPTLSINGNLSYASRSPRLYDAITAGGNRGVVSIADGTKAEKARNTEIGFNYNDGNFSANGSYYLQRIDNALGGFADSRHGKSTSIKNVGHMTNQGYELGAAYRYNGLTLRAGVADSNPKMVGETYIDIEDNNKLKNRLSENPEFATKVGRTWTVSAAYRFAEPNLEIGAKGRIVEGVDAVLLQGQAAQNKKGYSVADIYANYKPFNNDNLNVNFAVNNVLDANYRPHAQRPTVDTLVGAGRDFRVGINYTF